MLLFVCVQGTSATLGSVREGQEKKERKQKKKERTNKTGEKKLKKKKKTWKTTTTIASMVASSYFLGNIGARLILRGAGAVPSRLASSHVKQVNFVTRRGLSTSSGGGGGGDCGGSWWRRLLNSGPKPTIGSSFSSSFGGGGGGGLRLFTAVSGAGVALGFTSCLLIGQYHQPLHAEPSESCADGALANANTSAENNKKAKTAQKQKQENMTSTPTPPSPYTLAQKCAAEALGVFVIITGGCGAVCASNFGGAPLTHFQVAAAFGLAVTMAVYLTRDVSGAHLNPAITAALAVHDPEACPADTVAPYVGAQMFGATIGAALNWAAYRGGIASAHAAAGVVPGTAASAQLLSGAFHMIPNWGLVKSSPGALLGEMAMTAALAFVVFAIGDPDKSFPAAAAPALVGATVATIVLPGGPLTQCGMNPARDLGPRLVAAMQGGLKGAALTPAAWVYTVGPIVGAIAGGALYNATLRKKKKMAENDGE